MGRLVREDGTTDGRLVKERFTTDKDFNLTWALVILMLMASAGLIIWMFL